MLDMERFTIVSSQAIENVVINTRSVNTTRNNSWCAKLYRDWSTWRKEEAAEKYIPTLEELWTAPKTSIASALKHFVFEIKRYDGSEYPANTIYNIICGISRFIKENRVECNILDKEDEAFGYFVKSLDARMRDLTTRGVGNGRKTADPVTDEDETKLWSSGAFSVSDADGLLRAVYYYNCKAFGLRARDEHRKLTLNQVIFSEDATGKFVEFRGRGNKIYKGGIQDRKFQDKSVKQYESPQNNRSIYKLLKLYQDSLHYVGISGGPFYRRPLKSITSRPRFSKAPLGVNSICKLLPVAAKIAGLKGNITSHSGKVSCATKLFRESVDEQLIMSRTGHRTTQSVRLYKREAPHHAKSLSTLLDPPSNIMNSFRFSSTENFDINIDSQLL